MEVVKNIRTAVVKTSNVKGYKKLNFKKNIQKHTNCCQFVAKKNFSLETTENTEFYLATSYGDKLIQ